MDSRTTDFKMLLDEADRLLENDTANDQVVVVKTAKEKVYHCLNRAIRSGDTSDEDRFVDMLREKDDTEIKFIVALWNCRVIKCHNDGHSLDVPSQHLRRRLLELCPQAADALVLLQGEGVYSGRKLQELMPEKC